MYLSHPVRRMRTEPIPGETVTLVVGLGEADRAGLESALEGTEGRVGGELRYGDVVVSGPESVVADVCELDGVERIETANTLGVPLEDEPGDDS
jgi:hypothetical protein